MAKLVDLYRSDAKLSCRQLPLTIDDNLTMVMDLSHMKLICDSKKVRSKELADVEAKLQLLTPEQTKDALRVNIHDILKVLNESVPCVGCRRSVERLYTQIMIADYPTLDPIIISAEYVCLTIHPNHIHDPRVLCNLFHNHSMALSRVLDNQPRSKKSRRCLLHSLDSQRSRLMTSAWREVWDCMRPACKEEIVLIDAATLQATLETYLRKHRFCGECRAKVLRAFSLLVEDHDLTRLKGYSAKTYAGIKRCFGDKHLHLQTNTNYIRSLIEKAEPEIMGSRRERHAKTLEIAQEEVVTCLGICVYERLHRVYMRLREEECTCQILAAVAADCLCRNFETAVERKRGISQFELCVEELARGEQLKLHKQEKKKLKKRRKKAIKKAEMQTLDSEEKENAHEEDSFSESMIVNISSTESLDKMDEEEVELDEEEIVEGNCSCTKTATNEKQKKKDILTVAGNQKVPSEIVANTIKTKCLNGKWTNGAASSDDGDDATNDYHSDCQCDDEQPSNKRNKKKKNAQKDDADKPNVNDKRYSHNHGAGKSLSDAGNRPVIVNVGSTGSWSSNSDHSQDCGYSSEHNTGIFFYDSSLSSSLPSSTENSDVGCNYCNHDADVHEDVVEVVDCCRDYRSTPDDLANEFPKLSHQETSEGGNKPTFSGLSLQQMLVNLSADEDEPVVGEKNNNTRKNRNEKRKSSQKCDNVAAAPLGNCDVKSGDGGIPAEDVLAFKSKLSQVNEKRQQLRETLKERFRRMCADKSRPRFFYEE